MNNVSTTFLRRSIDRHGAAECYFTTHGTPDAIIDLLPLEQRTPQRRPGTRYHQIKDGSLTVLEADNLMDERLVVHTPYAERWMEQMKRFTAYVEHRDMVLPTVA